MRVTKREVIEMAEKDEGFVERIDKHKNEKGHLQFLVK